MARVWKDRVLDTSATTGTGTLTLAGAVTGFQAASAVGDGNSAYWVAYAVDGSGVPTGDWEVFDGTYTASGTTLSRDTVLDSSNSGSPVSFAGDTRIALVNPAGRSLVSTGVPTAGSVLFAGTDGVVTQDNGSLFFDAGNDRLGLLTTAPTHTLTLGSTSTGAAVYATVDQVTDYERVRFFWDSGTSRFCLASEAGGTGTQRELFLSGSILTFNANGGDRWMFDGSGHLLAVTDNSYDIGASGATRPRDGYFAGTVTVDGQFTGAGTGLTGTAASLTAGLATTLETARTIGGVSFNGTADIVPQTIESAAESSDSTCFLLFITDSGTQQLQPKNHTALTFDSTTGTLAATAFFGPLTGNASTVTVADAGGDTTTWVLLGTSQTGSLAPATDAGLTFNATTNALTTTTFIGALTGNASTATALATARAINGTNFDGTADVTVTAAAATLTGLSAVTAADIGGMTADDDLLFGYDIAAGANRVFPASRLANVGGNQFSARLGTAAGGAVTTTDMSVISVVYLWPYKGDFVSLWDGTRWVNWRLPASMAINLTSLTASRGYDVWLFIGTSTPSSTNTSTEVVTFGSDPGWQTGAHIRVASTVAGLTAGTTYYYNRASSTTGTFHTTVGSALAGTSPVNLTANVTQAITGVSLEYLVWSSGTARATALSLQDGVYVKSGDATRRYVGSFYSSGTTTTEDTVTKRFLWNYYHRIEKSLLKNEPADSWAYTSQTIRALNNNSANKVEVFCGVAENIVKVSASVSALEQSAGGGGSVLGIGLDSITTNSAHLNGVTYWTATGLVLHLLRAEYRGDPGLGYHYLAAVESVTVGGITSTFYGDAGSPALCAAGLVGSTWC